MMISLQVNITLFILLIRDQQMSSAEIDENGVMAHSRPNQMRSAGLVSVFWRCEFSEPEHQLAAR